VPESLTPAASEPLTFHALRDGLGPLRPGPSVVDPEGVQRGRLIVAMVDAVAERGYGATTIGDVVALAKVSRRTFYECFADKEACFLAAYDAATDIMLQAIGESFRTAGPWEQRLLAGVNAYLHGLAREPAVSRVFLLEVLSAGPRALAHRREVLGRFAAQLRELVDLGRAEYPEIAPLTESMALAIVGGVNELVLAAVEEDRVGELPLLQRSAADFVRAVVAAAPTSD